MIISTKKIPTHPWKKPGQTATFEKFVGTPGQAVKNRDVPGKTGTSGHPSIGPPSNSRQPAQCAAYY